MWEYDLISDYIFIIVHVIAAPTLATTTHIW